MHNLPELTEAQRAELLEKARAAYDERRALFQSQAHLLKNDFMDKPYWRRLCSKHGVRMPADYVPGTELRLVRKAMRKAGVTPDQVREAFGGDVKALQRDNPTWPAYALIGLILEIAEENAQ